MSFKELLKINRYKLAWFIGLLLFFWFRGQFIDFAEFVFGLIFSTVGPFQITRAIQIFAITLNFILNIILFYMIACLIVYIYEKVSAKYPKIKEFFELTPAKYKIIGALFILFIIFANLSAISIKYWYNEFAIIFFATLSMILGADDVTIIHRFYQGLPVGLDKLPSLMMAILWWYLLACIIMYIKNKITKNNQIL